jgi:hypothetical protein
MSEKKTRRREEEKEEEDERVPSSLRMMTSAIVKTRVTLCKTQCSVVSIEYAICVSATQNDADTTTILSLAELITSHES